MLYRFVQCLVWGVLCLGTVACSAPSPTPRVPTVPPTQTHVAVPPTATPVPISTPMPPSPTPVPKPVFRIVGYITDWGVPVGEGQIAKLTHVNYAFALPRADGTIDFPPNQWKLDQVVQIAHAHRVEVLLSVGGWGLDKQFEAFAASADLRALFIRNLVAYVDERNLDGVDLDWEYPVPGASSDNFRALLRELRAALDARHKLLTAAVAAYGDNASGIPADVFSLLDFVNLMAYAESGAHHSTYALARQTLDYWHARGLPQSKMVLGVPFYAQPGDVAYRKLVASDPTAANTDFSHYLGSTAAYNGLPTIRAKTHLALERASGIMIWTINDDSLDETSLLTAIQQTAQGKTADLPPLAFGAGFRFSTYGPPHDPGPQYWVEFGKHMAERFGTAPPQLIWIVGNLSGQGTQLTFFGKSEDLRIHFSTRDRNEEALTLFDQIGAQVWLQVEPGDAPVDTLIELVLEKYAHHPSVIGVGVDVEWYKSTDQPQGQPVSDADARLWRDMARTFNPTYRLFLKHWQAEMLPPTEREGLVFVDDSQQFSSLDAMVAEFAAWGKHFAPAQVAFQFGYPDDKKWWGELKDPPQEIGSALRAQVPNVAGLYWVDFTALDVFPENK